MQQPLARYFRKGNRLAVVALGLGLSACSAAVNCGAPAGPSLAAATPSVSNAGAGELARAAAAMGVGEFRVLNTKGYDAALLRACDSKQNVLEWSNRGYWDSGRGEFHFVGQGHYACGKHLVYSEAANSWSTAAAPSFGVTGHGYEHNAMDPATGTLFFRRYNSTGIDRFDRARGAWTDLPPVPTGAVQVAGAIEYFPELQGLVFVNSVSGVWLYQEPSEAWAQLAGPWTTQDIGPYHNFATYNPGAKMVLFGGGNGSTATYKLGADCTVTRLADSPAELGIKRAMVLPNPASGNFLAFHDNGQFYEYRVAENTWTSAGTHPVMTYAKYWRVGALVEPRGVFMFIVDGWEKPEVLLYKY